MRDWFYTKAKLFKQAAFFVSGTAVAASTATAIADSTASWITNLIAIVGCSVYSSFDNIEAARAIIEQEKNIQQLVARLSLQDYQGDNPPISLKEILENISSLEMNTEDLTAAIDQTAEELKQSLAQKYARMNWIAQMMTSIITGAINIWANVEEDTEDRENLLTPKNILNITLVPVCMLVWQCWGHYRTTKNLQEMTEKTENLECILSQASKSLVFRAYEFRLFTQHREKVEDELTKCQKEIGEIESDLNTYERRLETIDQELVWERDINNRQRQDELSKEQAEIQRSYVELNIQLNKQKETQGMLEIKNRSLVEEAIQFGEIEEKIEAEVNKVHELMPHLLAILEAKR